ncbi:MAG: flagellar biosynthesis protein FlhB [Tepidisphaeraceae bacterium]|jgi:flagellar biosynthetic protein FlhB
MAESSGDKTEAPTPRRRQEAREQGNIARSHDLTSAVLLIGGLLLLKWFGMNLLSALRSIVEQMLSVRSLSNVNSSSIADQALGALGQIGANVAPVLGGVMLIVIAVNIAQVGLILSPTRIQPNLAALNPFRGIGKILGRGQGPIHLLMNIVKVVLVGLVAYSAIGDRLGEIISVQRLTFLQSFGIGAQIVFNIGMRVGFLLLLLAIFDYVNQRQRVEQSLRMTKQEVKDEMRRMDGDPMIKQRRRQIAIARAKERLKKEVPTADVVVTNPTHFAVALKYDPSMHAPKLVAKGADFLAQRIRELAIEAGVPIVERAPLARAIYRMVDVGDEIPEQFYSAVAEILAYVYELNRKAKKALAV